MPNSFSNTLPDTEYHFEGQSDVYHGKVRDVYAIGSEYVVLIATDRISAFDRVLPRAIPYKGQVLNQTAAYFLEATKDLVPNWLLSVPDENASIGRNCKPFKIELVVRNMLVGHAWREYKAGKRSLCGEKLPDGLQEFDLLDGPIITPSTKAASGHDEDISKGRIIASGLATPEQYENICSMALKLFAAGQKMAGDRGLILADTKYEFGLLDGKILVIDEIHTPDSSRYFYLDGHDEYIKDRTADKPKHLSKEFARNWLMENGFFGEPGQTMPEMSDEVVRDISERYIELYEQITGKSFIKPAETDILERIENNVAAAIGGLR